MTDWRALCEELTHEVEQYAEDRGDLMPECADRARAALAEEPAVKPAPPAEGEVGELLRELRDAAFDLNGSDPAKSMLTRAADLLSIAYATGPEVWEPIPLLPAQRHHTPVPGGMIPVEYWDIDSGARIVTEPSEEGPGGCWVVLNSRHVNPLTEFPTAKAAWDALQQAHALPLPQGGVE